ncbi:DUF4309 domain-containing protein [Brevibacillus sp. SYP-B805]|uniref:stalk domain-containing protein n=1 Tax=Brevibacillus sp. SYP-B805 TaxID=1578199 RepID=UPI0013EBD9A7|nr:stalk domain-containing protein [Brevibacillus sp. SYP-B805]NGQ94899.1 DUF4309 domain-containing protein [Brevibacillus sp. SYP-B805]
MKRLTMVLFHMAFGLIIALAAGRTAHAADAPAAAIEVDGNVLTYMEQFEYTIVQDRLLVSAAELFASLGAQVEHDPAWTTITAVKGSNKLQLRAGTSFAVVNGQRVKLPLAPRPQKGGMLVPLRFVSESLGAQVEWVAYARTAVIATRPKDFGIVEKEMLALAARGEVKGIPVTLGAAREDIEKTWGKPVDTYAYEGGIFHLYAACGCAVLYDDTGKAAILWVFQQQIGYLRAEDVRRALGKPEWERESDTHAAYLLRYPAQANVLTFFATFRDGTITALWLEKNVRHPD